MKLRAVEILRLPLLYQSGRSVNSIGNGQWTISPTHIRAAFFMQKVDNLPLASAIYLKRYSDMFLVYHYEIFCSFLLIVLIN